MPNSMTNSSSDSSNSNSESSCSSSGTTTNATTSKNKSSNKRPIDVVTFVDDDSCSLQDVIDMEKERSDIASAVLGASDHTNCSYAQGYVYRQALYSCLTCANIAVPNETAKKDGTGKENEKERQHGICLACSYDCHQNHELVELYTKRDFRCDCGNASKFPKLKCNLEPNKDAFNAANKYNHNFSGVYCVCNKPYPDPAAEKDDEELKEEENDSEEGKEDQNENGSDSGNEDEDMIQCAVCEDWFHLAHLPGHELFPASDEDYDEMICHMCMQANPFLWSYQAQMVTNKATYSTTPTTKTTTKEKENDIVDIEEVEEEGMSKKNVIKKDGNGCFLKKLKSVKSGGEEGRRGKACCFAENWREVLCKCSECMSLYKNLNVEFLVRINDTIRFYEDSGKTKETNIDGDKLLGNELAKLDRFSQVELAHNFNDFRTELKDFLGSFAQNGEVVKAENVTNFFSKLNERKKRKHDA